MNKNDVLYIVEELQISEVDIPKVCEYYEVSISELSDGIKEGDIRIFDNMKAFFYWMFQGSSSDLLLETLWDSYNKKEILNQEQMFRLDDKRIIYMMK